MYVKSPCYGCRDRTLGCHGHCDKYKEFKVKNNLIKEVERQNRNPRSYSYSKYASSYRKGKKIDNYYT